MPSKSTAVPKRQVSKPLSALHIRVCTDLCYSLLSLDLSNMREIS